MIESPKENRLEILRVPLGGDDGGEREQGDDAHARVAADCSGGRASKVSAAVSKEARSRGGAAPNLGRDSHRAELPDAAPERRGDVVRADLHRLVPSCGGRRGAGHVGQRDGSDDERGGGGEDGIVVDGFSGRGFSVR